MGRREMAMNRAILILEEGKEKYIIMGDADFKILLAKGAKVVDLVKTPSGHLAMKADDYANATAKRGNSCYTLHASKGEPHALEEHIDIYEHATSRNATELHAAQAAEDAGQPASSGCAHTYMMNQKYDHLDYIIECHWTEEV